MSLPLVSASGSIKDGRLFIRDRAAFDSAVSSLKDGTQVEIELVRMYATRSLSQNALYWSVVVELLSQHTGYTPEEMHHWLKVKFLPRTMAVSTKGGDIVAEFVVGGSTRKLKTHEFSDYIEAIKRWAAEDLDVYIPDADERGYGAGV